MTSPTPTAPQTLPLFFKELVALDSQAHRVLTLPRERKGFAFTAGAPLLPLTFAEVGQALRHYPVVFVAEDEELALVALTGLPGGRNLFVDAWGEWRSNTYIPAYVRGYPFIAVRPAPQVEPILALDPQALDFKAEDGQPLIAADGQSSEQLKGILAFHGEHLQLAERTQAMTRSLKQAGVLEEGNFQIQPAQGGEPQQFGGFLVVSEQKLKALPTEALKALVESDALGLAYAQIFSLASLGNLFAEAGPATLSDKPKVKRARKKVE